LSSQVTVTCDGALLSWRWLDTGLLMGSSEWISCFAWLACEAFALPIKVSLSQSTTFLTFTLLTLSHFPLWQGVSEWLCEAKRPARVNPHQKDKQGKNSEQFS